MFKNFISLIKSKNCSNKLINDLAKRSFSKVDPDEREKKQIKKLEKFWEDVDKQTEKRKELEKEIENKYNYESEYVGRNIVNENNPDLALVEKLEEVYYVPLTREDESLLSANFSGKVIEQIKKGGRIVLLNELKAKNVPFEFIPLDLKEVDNLKTKFYEIYKNPKIFNYILQKGKETYDELINFQEERTKAYKSTQDGIKYIDHYSEVVNNYPFNTKITSEFQKYDDPLFVKLFLNSKKIDEVKLNEEFTKMYHNFYEEIVNYSKTKKPNEFYKFSHLEESFNDRINIFLDYLRVNSLEIKMQNDSENFKAKNLSETSYIFDKIFIKGVYSNRYSNLDADYYTMINTQEDKGIRFFMNKFIQGAIPPDSTTENKSNEYANKVKFEMKERNKNIVLRLYLFIKHPGKIVVSKKGGNDNVLEYPNNFTYNHLVVFENELESPHQLSLIKNNFQDWLLRHKLNLNNFKIVDVDNFMKGNPYFPSSDNFKVALETSFSTGLDYLEEKMNEKKSDNKTTNEDKKQKKPKEEKGNANVSNALNGNYKIIKIKQFVDKDEDIKQELQEIEKYENDVIEGEMKKLNISEENPKIDEFFQQLDTLTQQNFNNAALLENISQLYQKNKNQPKITFSNEPLLPEGTIPFKKDLKDVPEGIEKTIQRMFAKKIEKILKGDDQFLL